MSKSILAVDLGGTQLRVARFDEDLNVLERKAQPTLAHLGIDQVVDRMIGMINEICPNDLGDVMGLGVSAPGPINPHSGVIFSPPNLPGWESVPLRKLVQERIGCTTYLGNDANVAALAEATRGAARGYRYVIYLTVSTGIGSGIIDDGHLLLGVQGLGAEAGHIMMIMEDGRVTDLEEEAAGPAIAEKAQRRLQAGETSRIREMVEGDLSRITGETVGLAAADGDPMATELIAESGRLVGLGIVSLMHLFNPEIVVVGGGVTKTGDLLFEPMREAVRAHVLDQAYCESVPIVPAELGDNVALIGAAALVSTRGGRSLELTHHKGEA